MLLNNGYHRAEVADDYLKMTPHQNRNKYSKVYCLNARNDFKVI